MNDLISRKAAIEAVKIPDDGCNNPSERHGIIFARVEARKAIQSIPIVPAVPLDKLCEWLSESSINIPCTSCANFVNEYCTAIGDASKPCPNSADGWRRAITEWMEEQDAADRC